MVVGLLKPLPVGGASRHEMALDGEDAFDDDGRQRILRGRARKLRNDTARQVPESAAGKGAMRGMRILPRRAAGGPG
jgi:hypothetical protein